MHIYTFFLYYFPLWFILDVYSFFECTVLFSSVAHSCPTLVTSWTAVCQAFLSITNSRSPPKPLSTESVMPSNYLILGRPLLPLLSIFPRIRVFSNESALRIRCPKYWSFSFNISPWDTVKFQICRNWVTNKSTTMTSFTLMTWWISWNTHN